MSICGKNQCFLGLGGQFKPPPPPILQVLGSETNVLQGMGSGKWVFQPPLPPKWPFFAQKRPKNAYFGPKTVFPGLGGQFMAPPTVFRRFLNQKNVWWMLCKSENACFKATPPLPKWPFFAQKWPKNGNLGPQTVFFSLGWSGLAPPTLFCRWLTKENICCGMWEPENGCFIRGQPKKWPFFAKKLPFYANFGPKTLVFGFGWSV